MPAKKRQTGTGSTPPRKKHGRGQAGQNVAADDPTPPEDLPKTKSQTQKLKQMLVSQSLAANAENADIHESVEQAYKTMSEEAGHIFYNMDGFLPEQIASSMQDDASASAFQSPYRKEEHDKLLENAANKETAVYRCGIPLTMVHKTYSATPSVKLNMGQINHLKKTQYQTPKPLNVLTIATASGENVLEGGLTAISPEEDRIAFALRIAERVKAGAPDDELLEWRQHLVCAPAEFIQVDNQKRRFFCQSTNGARWSKVVVEQSEVDFKLCKKSCQRGHLKETKRSLL